MKNILNYFFCIILLFSCSSAEDNLDEILVKSITINGNDILDGKTSQLTAQVFPVNAKNKSITWRVSNESIAVISSNGLLTAVSNGSLTVFTDANDNSGVSVSKVISVSGVIAPPIFVEKITITGDNITDGSPKQLTAEILPANATIKAVSWSVSNTSIATINEGGLLTPVDNGTVIVKATSKDANAVYGELQITITGFSNIPAVSTTQELLAAIQNANAGDIIYLNQGTYNFTSTINISKNGAANNLISLISHPNNSQKPKLDFSSMSENSSNRGIQLNGNYWHIKGISVYKAGDNGMFIRGNNNLIEFCDFSENADTGLQIGNGGANNTILNCDSFFNADSSIENADGFACKLDAGTGNKFIGCRAWQNLDDGWDGYLKGADNITTTYENCWAINNGYLKDGTKGGGDGNGFKTGGSDNKDLKHHAIFKNCLAVGNVVDGFDHNSNRGDITIYNSGAYKNGRNINFSSSNIANSLIIKNTVSFSGVSGDSYNATSKDITNNSWQNGIVTNVDDFVSLNIALLLSPRKADGSLPDIDFMKLVSGSDLIDKGVNIGLPFNGSAPDIGPFEK